MKKLSLFATALVMAGLAAPALADAPGFLKVSGQDVWYFDCSWNDGHNWLGYVSALLNGNPPWVCR